MSKFSRMLEAKADQSAREAMMLCARHGKAGGLFDTYRWCNGVVMAEPCFADGREALPNQCIPLTALNELRRNNWIIYTETGHDCGEGPWQTKKQAEDFARAEVGAPHVVRKVGSKWHVIVAPE